MQVNHKPIDIDYNKTAILDVLLSNNPKVDRPRSNLRICSKEEISIISDMLGTEFPITNILYFQLDKQFVGSIHKDLYYGRYVTRALILPLTECKDVYMKWFTQNNNTRVDQSFRGPNGSLLIPHLSHNNATCIDNVNCSTPSMVKVDDWHSIENNSTEEFSHIISLRFE